MTSDDIIDGILKREGGYVNNSADLGGPTNFGITIKTLSDSLKRPATDDDVRNITLAGAKQIYQSIYVTPFEALAAEDDALLALMVDSAVQHGVERVRGWIAAIQPGNDTYKELLKTRVVFYGTIITSRPANAQFAHGWANRVAQFIR